LIRNGKNGLPAEKVGELILHALTTPRPRVRYAPAPGNFIFRYLQTALPKRLIDWIIAKNLGFDR
ncbi:MAG TPA: hypothetical protein VKP08_20705, partial [Anaerolineales bacterium]|nr:hypothetical protein [Anaerolineales bacterium]